MGPNAQKLERLFHRFWKDRDWDADEGVFADDIEWVGLEAIGLDGRKVGPRAVGKFFADWLEMWEDYDNDVTVVEVTPDLIVTENHFRGRGKGSGIEFESELGQIWEFESGLVVRQTMYRTIAEAHEEAAKLKDGVRPRL